MNFRRMLFLVVCAAVASAQVPEKIQRYRSEPQGGPNYRKSSILDGNRIRTLFTNTGQVAQWPFSPSFEWPAGSLHQYLDGYTFMAGAQVRAPGNGQLIHLLETAYREEVSRDPITGVDWGLEPVPGYTSASSYIAMSSNASSYPMQWPAALGVGSDWDGRWYGYFGKGTTPGLTETFYVMDDSKDAKFTMLPYAYYPFTSDPARGGMGLRVEVRGLQFDRHVLNDVLFWTYSVTNISDRNYDTTAFGVYIDPGVGGDMSGNDDVAYSRARNLLYTWDHAGVSTTGSASWIPGYCGITVLAAPSDTVDEPECSAKTGLLTDKGPTGLWPKNNDAIWNALTGGIQDSLILNTNLMAVMGSGIFPFPKWSTRRFDVAMMCGTDAVELIMKKQIAAFVHRHNFAVSDSLAALGTLGVTLTSPAGTNPLVGTVNISWDVQRATGGTYSYVYVSSNDAEWKLAGIDSLGTRTITWNTALFPDGIFYRIRIVTFSGNDAGFFESPQWLRVNNPGNAKPEIVILSPQRYATLTGTTTIVWRGGDADGNVCTVDVFYRQSPQTLWSCIADSIPVTAGGIQWNTREILSSFGPDFYFKVDIRAGIDTVSAVAGPFTITNEFTAIPVDPMIVSKKTRGTGSINLLLADDRACTGHTYCISFAATPSLTLAADVTDLDRGVQVLSGVQPLDSLHASPYFDGIRLRIHSDRTEKNVDATGWVGGKMAFPIISKFDNSINAARNVQQPYDYEITFANDAVDTTFYGGSTRYPQIPVPFTVMNLTNNIRCRSLVDDNDRSGSLTPGDTIRIIDDYVSASNFHVIWALGYGPAGYGGKLPAAGDVYRIVTRKPFAVGDSILFSTRSLQVYVEQTEGRIAGYALAQNYPNPFNPATTIEFSLPSRSRVTLKVFDMVGREVTTLISQLMPGGRHRCRWNAAGLPSGVYFYRLQAGAYTETKKLMLLK